MLHVSIIIVQSLHAPNIKNQLVSSQNGFQQKKGQQGLKCHYFSVIFIFNKLRSLLCQLIQLIEFKTNSWIAELFIV